ncbi:MAG: glycerophosphodiester phosphodiesterase family protein [Gammaproteobacteria bacterium]|nr:glycerophosphodiester phosphodiesterase family protein [Gammaproteobacteria bacterium]
MTNHIYLVAHRGEPDSYPENSLASFSHALDSGATHIETDVQVTADNIVVLSHDENLNRLTGKNISITKSNFALFKDIPAGFSSHFSGTFNHSRIASLKQFSDLLTKWPEVICFIEIKQESLSCFGNRVVDLVMEALEEIKEQCVLISFNYDALVYARDKYPQSIGWVLPDWSDSNQVKADRLSPEYLFVDTDFFPQNKNDLWQGPWQWVAYTINTVEQIKTYADLGVNIIETNRLSQLQREYGNTIINAKQ